MKKYVFLIVLFFVICTGVALFFYYRQSEKQDVSVVFITDDSYVVPTVVAITSALHNKKPETNLNIYVLGNNLNKENKKLLGEMPVHLLDYEKSLPDIEKIQNYVSVTALIKFYLSDVFSKKNKILYIDADTIIQGDLEELFNTDLTDCYAAVVKDLTATKMGKGTERLDLKNYFNTGVMLLNLDKIRQDNLPQKMMEYKLTKDEKKFMDQDAFNVVFEEKVKYLSVKYNWMPNHQKYFEVSKLQEFYDLDENLETKDAVIVHFINKQKPWKNKDVIEHFLWDKYYYMSPLKDRPILYEENR